MVWGVFFPVILFMYINFVIFCIVKVYSLFLSYCLCLFSGQLEGRQLHFVFLFECRNIELIKIADYKKKKRCFCLSFGKCNCEFYRVLFSSDSHNLAFPGNYNLLFNNTLLINFVVQTIDEPYVLVSFSTPLQHYTFQKALHSIRFINMVSEQLFLLEF